MSDLIADCKKVVGLDDRVLVTTPQVLDSFGALFAIQQPFGLDNAKRR
jgi:hypothetical protein